jgi:hypothetical protein
MKTKHPNFILGIISFVLLFIGIGLKANSYRLSDYVLIGAVVLGGIHWIWSIIDVVRDKNIGQQSRVIWLIITILVPPLGGMFYYLMGTRQVKM